MELLLKDEQVLFNVCELTFGRRFNQSLVHQVITMYQNCKRQGSKAQKNRSEVSGSGKKPWRQKGTGRARAGSLRSPLWRSGGVTFAAKSKDYAQKINKKMYRGAMKSIFSELVRQQRLMVFKNFSIESPKTKELVKKLKNLELENVLIITHKVDHNLVLASRNLYKVNVCNIGSIDPVSLIAYEQVIITTTAISKVEDMFS